MSSAIQAVTQRLPWFVRDPAVAVIGEKCYRSLVHDLNLADKQCLEYSMSKFLGLGIVLGGSIVKVPQIIKIVNGRSARGLSLASFLLDSAGTGINVAYNVRKRFPWSTYGESVFLLIQNAVIIALIIIYSRNSTVPTLTIVFSGFALASYALASESIVPASTLKMLLGASIPLSLSSKVPQILSNLRLGSTGQLSAFLVFNSLLGCLARVYTTATETGDDVLWWGFVGAAVLNGVIALQMLASWNAEDTQHQRVAVPVPASASRVSEKVSNKVTDQAKRVEAALATPVKNVSSNTSIGNTPASAYKTPGGGGTASPARTASPASAKRYVRKLE